MLKSERVLISESIEAIPMYHFCTYIIAKRAPWVLKHEGCLKTGVYGVLVVGI